MLQKTYFFRTTADIKPQLTELKKLPEYVGCSSALVLLFVNGFIMGEAEEYVDAIKQELPNAALAGLSVISSSMNWDENGVTASILLFKESKAEVFTFESTVPDSEVAERMTQIINDTKDVKAVIAFPSDISDFSKTIDTISENINPDIAIFGALSASSTYFTNNGIEFNQDIIEFGKSIAEHPEKRAAFYESLIATRGFISYSIGEKTLGIGTVFVVLSGANLFQDTRYVLGWNKFGKKMVARLRHDEKSATNFCVTEIDGRPAAELYEQYLDVEDDEFFMDNVCEFPICIDRDGCTIARVPLYTGNKGELYFSGDIRDGEIMKLSYAVPFEVLKKSEKVALEVNAFAPEALILNVCYNRYHFLKEREEKEIALFSKHLPESVFFFGGYEIYKKDGEGGILNSALVSFALRECEPPKQETIPEEKLEAIKKPKPLIERLVTFVDVSSKELEEAYEKADAANISKSAFLSNMSHEIRTPINAIIGMDEMILREAGDETILGYATDIKNASINLLGIVNDILDFSKIEAGKMQIVPVEYELASVLNDLVNMVKKRAEDKGLDVRVNVDPTLPHILYGDEIRIKQVITNILTNAVKYTKKGGVVLSVQWKTCSVGDVDGVDSSVSDMLNGDGKYINNKNIAISFSIEDTGIGMKNEDLPKLYNAFERIEEERNRTIEGAGLGMNITQKLLKLMGSELDVKSDYGVGTLISFDLVQKVVDPRPIGDFEDALRRFLSTREEYHQSFVAPNARVLVVDDTKMNITVFTNLLKQTQIEIDSALSGAECLEMASKRKYDIIFLDHRMPKMDGIECLQHLKEDKNGLNFNTPVIALTANAVSGSREMYLDAGFDNYLTKPIVSGLLERMIVDYLPDELVGRTEEDMGKYSEAPLPEWIDKVPFVDIRLGVENCGGNDAYREALKSYMEAIDDNAAAIENALVNGRIDDYTIKVHALKSSSKIVGAIEIGTLAEELERAGNENNMEVINAFTDELLSYYKSLGYVLKRYMIDEDEKGEKPEISPEKLAEAYSAIKEIAQLFDYDSLTAIIESIEEYEIPDSEQEKYESLKKAINNADWDAINKLVEG